MVLRVRPFTGPAHTPPSPRAPVVFTSGSPHASPDAPGAGARVLTCRGARCLRVRQDGSVRVRRVGGGAVEVQLDRAFGPGALQEDVYASVVEDPVRGVTQGYNATVFAYGQTGTGKTYTMFGEGFTAADEAAPAGAAGPDNGRGMIQRAAADLFSYVEQKEREGLQMNVTCSYLEIYNERIHDLLEPYKVAEKQASTNDPYMIHARKAGLEIRDDGRGVHVPGLTTVEVPSLSAVQSVLLKGNRHREVKWTEMNEASSRSHSLLQIVLKQQTGPEAKTYLTSKLNLVDLAGSERFPDEEIDNCRIAELTSINTSLSALATVVASLADRGKAHIPYRDSKLTHLLHDSLGGNCWTTFIATVSPVESAIDETISTLKFIDRAKNIRTSAVVNIQSDPGAAARAKDEEIARLQKLLKSFVEGEGEEMGAFQKLTEKVVKYEREHTKLKLEVKSLKEELQRERQLRVSLQMKWKERNNLPIPVPTEVTSEPAWDPHSHVLAPKNTAPVKNGAKKADRSAGVKPNQNKTQAFSLDSLHPSWKNTDGTESEETWDRKQNFPTAETVAMSPDKESTPMDISAAEAKGWGRSSITGGAPAGGKGWGRSAVMGTAKGDKHPSIKDIEDNVVSKAVKKSGTFDKGSLIYILGRQSSSLNAAKVLKSIETEAWGQEG